LRGSERALGALQSLTIHIRSRFAACGFARMYCAKPQAAWVDESN